MAKSNNKIVFMLLNSMLIGLAAASGLEIDTALRANGAFSDLMTTKTSYFRSLCDANPLKWDQSLADKAATQVWNCSLEYDYWSPEGQIIFRMVGDDNQIINAPNATYFAVGHWYDMRENYTNIQSDEYDELQPFYPAWEFTEMVWKTNTYIGCAYAEDVVCPALNPVDFNMYQLYCLLTPGGNKWDQWGANVECKDCTDVQPQTSTINTATITFSGQKRATARTVPTPATPYDPPSDLVKESLAAAMHRIEKYLTMDNDEFMSRWDLLEGTPMTSVTPNPSK